MGLAWCGKYPADVHCMRMPEPVARVVLEVVQTSIADRADSVAVGRRNGFGTDSRQRRQGGVLRGLPSET